MLHSCRSILLHEHLELRVRVVSKHQSPYLVTDERHYALYLPQTPGDSGLRSVAYGMKQ